MLPAGLDFPSQQVDNKLETCSSFSNLMSLLGLYKTMQTITCEA